MQLPHLWHKPSSIIVASVFSARGLSPLGAGGQLEDSRNGPSLYNGSLLLTYPILCVLCDFLIPLLNLISFTK
jgi:hypothetical protein